MNRRTLLRGMLGGTAVAVGLPLLEQMLDANGTALANGGALPVRFGLFFWGNGVVPDHWIPQGTGTGWVASEGLAPVEHLRSVLTIVTGTSMRLPNIHPHSSGAAGILSGAPVLADNPGSFSAPTIDQIIAAEVGDATLFRSLQTAATDINGLSWNGPNSRNPAESDPYALYERLFGPTFVEPGSGGVVDPRLGLRRSVLDGVMGDIAALQGRLGSADRTRLDQHLTGVRELETRLARLQEDPPDLEACVAPEAPLASFPDIDGRPQLQARNRAIAKLLAMAFACDQTRVFGHYFTEPINDVLFTDATAGHHDLTHNEPGDQPEVQAITLQVMEAYAAFVEEFQAIPEGGATLLDSCAILGCTEHSLGRTHSVDDLPLLIAGSACNAIVNGVHHRAAGQDNASKVMLTLVRAAGVLAPTFGVDEAETSDGLSEIEV
ncbi:MAG: DUF1552 domain-containing protein [Alphaproteobacteria bacterium]|nr:DUF1552 domain-containing protein [Alphaproteobacteria bacterium]